MTLRAGILAGILGVSACASGFTTSFPRVAEAPDCDVERLAHEAGEHHFSFRGIAPNGKRLIVGYSARGDTVQGTYMLDLESGLRMPVLGINNGGSYSPDGNRIVTAMYVSPRNTEIVEMNLSGGAITRIAPDSAFDFLPSYSPDGKSIVFNSYRTGRSDLYVYERATKSLRRLTTFDGYDAHAQFSPDGKSIVFHRAVSRTDYNLMLLDLATGNERALTSAPGEEAYPAFSPSGREIVYVDDRDSTASTDLYVLSLADLSAKRLVSLPTYEGYPAWSRDGRYVYFTSRTATETFAQRVAMDGLRCRKPAP
jgi:Tol biopolymer transport system component